MRHLDACTVVCYSRESEALGHNTWTQWQLHYGFQQVLPILFEHPEAPSLPAPLPSSSFALLFLSLQSSWICWLMGGGRSMWTTAVGVFFPILMHKCVCLFMNVCVNVLHNLGSCANPRMHCTFPKSRNSTQTSRLSRHSSIVQYVCAISRLHEWNLLTFWQLVMRETVHRRPPVPKVSDVTNRSAEGGFDSLS